MRDLTAEKITSIKPDDVHIHVLRMNVEKELAEPDHFLALLPPDERGQYGRLQSPHRRREFLWSRLLVRFLFAGYLKKDICDLKFGRQNQGKPFLAGSELQFNLSHTPGLTACSFSRRAVGIDVEKIDTGSKMSRPWALIAERFFSPDEREYLFSRPARSQRGTFFQIFTMKEAYVKALGRGISLPLSSFTIPLPLVERSRSGRWEYFTKTLKPAGHCLAHVVDNWDKDFCRYETYDWDQASLSDVLKEYDFSRRSARTRERELTRGIKIRFTFLPKSTNFCLNTIKDF